MLVPARAVASLCEAPDRLLAKTQDKLLDFDAAQSRLQATKDPAKVPAVSPEWREARAGRPGTPKHGR